MFSHNFHTQKILLLASALLFFSCNKILEIPEPKNTTTTVKVFNTDAQANSAMVSVLSMMINGTNSGSSMTRSFSTGLTMLLGSLSADDLVYTAANGSDLYQFSSNTLNSRIVMSTAVWSSAYLAIYGSNAVVEGIEASTSPLLHPQSRKALTAEAKFMRAFCYFYLVNTYGDVPLALTTDFNKLITMPRTSATTVYQQIVRDLEDAIPGLSEDYSIGGGERIRANKWVAKALLARVYLFTGQYDKAAVEAGDVIAQTGLYQLETNDLNNVFLKNSSEAIWQLQQATNLTTQGNATPEGVGMLPRPLHTGALSWGLTEYLLKAFEPGDLRRSKWVDSTNYQNTRIFFSYKYKVGQHNMAVGVESTEYAMVLRLAEQYLIRAEARAILGQTALAIQDLNVLRSRAGLNPLSSSLSNEQTLAAVAKERQTELFTEWGHRWFDLKRTGKAEAVLSAIPFKQPWRGSYQLLYPIPESEIKRDHFLIQNPNY
jgi:hypothetical protein